MAHHEALSILEVISKSSLYLERKGISSHKIDSEWLVSFVLGCNRMELYLRFGEILEGNVLNEIINLVMQRGKRIPLQHILGEVQFAGLTIKSDHRALVPRFETEFLVDFLYHKLSSDFDGKIADLGCGGGAIILSLCFQMPKVHGCGFDRSLDALCLANENLSLCKLEDRISFKEFDWLKQNKLSEKYDLIVSNPPYLSKEEWCKSQPEVKKYDPRDALIAENEGFSDIERVVLVATNSLVSKGLLALEFGSTQADFVQDILSANFTTHIIPDQNLVRRFALAVKKD